MDQALSLGDKLASVWGAELSGDAIRSAKSNAAFHYREKDFHYEVLSITSDGLKGKLPPLKGKKERIDVGLDGRKGSGSAQQSLTFGINGGHLGIGAAEVDQQYGAHWIKPRRPGLPSERR